MTSVARYQSSGQTFDLFRTSHLHEYESLLFSDTDAFAGSIGQPGLANRLRAVRAQFATPEDINDDPETAPSKQVIKIHPRYQKVIDGTLAARAVGIQRMRQECPHFDRWIVVLESLKEL